MQKDLESRCRLRTVDTIREAAHPQTCHDACQCDCWPRLSHHEAESTPAFWVLFGGSIRYFLCFASWRPTGLPIFLSSSDRDVSRCHVSLDHVLQVQTPDVANCLLAHTIFLRDASCAQPVCLAVEYIKSVSFCELSP